MVTFDQLIHDGDVGIDISTGEEQDKLIEHMKETFGELPEGLEEFIRERRRVK